MASLGLKVPVRMLLVGSDRSEFKTAAKLADASGAIVQIVPSPDDAVGRLRESGGDLVMVDVGCDVAKFIEQLRAERIMVPVIACGVDASADRAVAAIHAGAQDYVSLPPDADLIAAAITSVSMRSVEIVGVSSAFRRSVDFALAMSKSPLPVMITGERGVGKEMIARVIHEASGRGGRFVVVNCASGNADVIMAELFGQEVGAFEGAVAQRTGGIEQANGGTIYLRDIDALDLAAQGHLQELLENRRMRRLGAEFYQNIDIRLVASTCRNLADLAASGEFLDELWQQVNLVNVVIPPLRERPDDIAALAGHFAERFARLNGFDIRPVTAKAIEVLRNQHWSSNVQELEHVMLRAVILARSGDILPEHLTNADGSVLQLAARPVKSQGPAGLVGRTMAEVERDLILQTLQHCGGNRTSASSILGISVRTMRNKIKSFVEAGIPIN
jgi:DNA-binding NtrC family response regulator